MSNWPIDGKISKASRANHVYPEKKYLDSTQEKPNSTERNRSPNERQRDSSPIERQRVSSPKQNQRKEERPRSNERKRENSPHPDNKRDNQPKNKKIKDPKMAKTYNCCSKSCGSFLKMPLWYICFF
jgi:hypothetical protein